MAKKDKKDLMEPDMLAALDGAGTLNGQTCLVARGGGKESELIDFPLTVKQVCALTGVTPRQLQHYDNIGLLCPARSGEGVANNRKLYVEDDLEQLKKILVLQDYGLELKDVGEAISGGDGALIEALEGQLRVLRAAENRLKNLVMFARFAQVVDDDDVFEVLINGAYEIDDFAAPMMETPAYAATCDAAEARSDNEWDALWDEFAAIVEEYVVPEGDTAFCDHERTVERLRDWWGRYNAPLHERGLLGQWLMFTEGDTAPALAEAIGGEETPGFLQADLFLVWAKQTLCALVEPAERLAAAEECGDVEAVTAASQELMALFCEATGISEMEHVLEREGYDEFFVDVCEGLMGYLDGLLVSNELMAYIDPEGVIGISREALSRAEEAIKRAAREREAAGAARG